MSPSHDRRSTNHSHDRYSKVKKYSNNKSRNESGYAETSVQGSPKTNRQDNQSVSPENKIDVDSLDYNAPYTKPNVEKNMLKEDPPKIETDQPPTSANETFRHSVAIPSIEKEDTSHCIEFEEGEISDDEHEGTGVNVLDSNNKSLVTDLGETSLNKTQNCPNSSSDKENNETIDEKSK